MSKSEELLLGIVNDLLATVNKAKAELETLKQTFLSKPKANDLSTLLSSQSFLDLVKQINNKKGKTISVLISAATFPKGQFLTSRALEERRKLLGFTPVGHRLDRLFGVVYNLKKSSKIVRDKHYRETTQPLIPLFDEKKIKNWEEDMKGVVDAQSLRKDIQSVFRINDAGRQKAIEIAKMFKCDEDVIKFFAGGE